MRFEHELDIQMGGLSMN